MILTVCEVAKELRMSERWLRDWLASHPVDRHGVPFYLAMGRCKRFEPTDVERIKSAIREGERCRLSSTGVETSGIIVELLTGSAHAAPAKRRKSPLPRVRFRKSKAESGKVISMDHQRS